MNTAVMERPPLVSIIGTVVHKSPAPAANRSGKIKLDNGAILSAFPDKLAQIEEGHAYDFGCVESNKSGVIYRDVKTARLVPQPQAFHAPESHAPASAIRSQQQQSTPPRSQAARTAAADQQRSAPVNDRPEPQQFFEPKPRKPSDSKQIWVCAMLRADIEANRVGADETELDARAEMWGRIWERRFGQDGASA